MLYCNGILWMRDQAQIPSPTDCYSASCAQRNSSVPAQPSPGNPQKFAVLIEVVRSAGNGKLSATNRLPMAATFSHYFACSSAQELFSYLEQ